MFPKNHQWTSTCFIGQDLVMYIPTDQLLTKKSFEPIRINLLQLDIDPDSNQINKKEEELAGE